MNFIKMYQHYLERDYAHMMQVAQQPGFKNPQNFDKVCAYKGKMVEKLSEERDTYFECNCPEAHGPFCGISEGLHSSASHFVLQLLKEMETTDLSFRAAITIIKTLQKAFLNRESLNRISFYLLSLRDKSSDQFDLMKYLSAIDVSIISYNELMREHERSTKDNFDISNKRAIPEIHGYIELLLAYSEDSVKNELS